jgi:ABC-2 type transport system permease protein
VIAKYAALFRIGVQSSLAYRFDTFLMVISIGVSVLLQLVLWRAVFSQSSQPLVYGFSFQQIVVYTLLCNVIPKITRASFEYEMAEDVKKGGIGRFLVAPISYFGYRLFVFLGANAANLALALMVTLVASQLVAFGHISAGAHSAHLLAFAGALGVALILNFLFFFLIGLASFWTVEAWGVFEAARILVLILSGGIFPLEIFGPFWRNALLWLPFPYAVYFPIQVITGRLTTDAVLRGLLVQIVWVLLLGVVAIQLWKRGTRRLVTVGG